MGMAAAAATAAAPPRISHEEQEYLKKREVAELESYFGMLRGGRWQYCSLQDVEDNSPSVRDGLQLEKQRVWRRQYLHLIYKAGTALKMWVDAWAQEGCMAHLLATLTLSVLPARSAPHSRQSCCTCLTPAFYSRPSTPWGISSAAVLCNAQPAQYTICTTLPLAAHPHRSKNRYMSSAEVLCAARFAASTL